MTSAHGVTINATVVHNTSRNGIFVDDISGPTFSLSGSAFLGNALAPGVDAAGTQQWPFPQAAVYIGETPARMTNNVVAGAFDAGFTYVPPPCGVPASTIGFNEAAATRIGAFLLPASGSCVALSAFTVWKAVHVGVLTVDGGAPVTISNLTAADNHIAVSLNYVAGGSGGDGSMETTVITNSVIAGTTLATAGGGCGVGADSVMCHAVDGGDVTGVHCNSVLGSRYARAGILTPQYTGKGKLCVDSGLGVPCSVDNFPEFLCSLPWEQRYGVGTPGAHSTSLSNVAFFNFNETDCGGRYAVAIVQNPTQTDDPFIATAQGITWGGATAPGGRFSWAMDGPGTPGECANGVGCDSVNFINVEDVDGSFLGGAPGATLLGPNPELAWGSPACADVGDAAHGGGIACGVSANAPRLRSAVAWSAIRDAAHNNMGGLELTRVVDGVSLADNTTWFGIRTAIGRGPIDEMCAPQLYRPVYPHVLAVGMTTQLYWPASQPATIGYTFLSSDPTEAAVISLFIETPFTWQVWVTPCAGCPRTLGRAIVPANITDLTNVPRVTDEAGTYLFDPHRRRLWVTVTGGPPGMSYTLTQTAAIQLTMQISISRAEFSATGYVSNLALLLGIDPSRIHVVDVQAVQLVSRRALAAAAGDSGVTSVTASIADTVPTVVLNVSAASSNFTASSDSLAAYDAQMARLGLLANGACARACTRRDGCASCQRTLRHTHPRHPTQPHCSHRLARRQRRPVDHRRHQRRIALRRLAARRHEFRDDGDDHASSREPRYERLEPQWADGRAGHGRRDRHDRRRRPHPRRGARLSRPHARAYAWGRA